MPITRRDASAGCRKWHRNVESWYRCGGLIIFAGGAASRTLPTKPLTERKGSLTISDVYNIRLFTNLRSSKTGTKLFWASPRCQVVRSTHCPKHSVPINIRRTTKIVRWLHGSYLIKQKLLRTFNITVFLTVSLWELSDIRVILNVLFCSEHYVDISHMALSLIVHDLNIISADVFKKISLWWEAFSAGCHRAHQNLVSGKLCTVVGAWNGRSSLKPAWSDRIVTAEYCKILSNGLPIICLQIFSW